MFTLTKCENDPSLWFIFVWASRRLFLITKPELPSTASGCIYQTREWISVSCMSLKEKSCISGYLKAAAYNFCLPPSSRFVTGLFFNFWVKSQTVNNRTCTFSYPVFSPVRTYMRKRPDNSLYYLGMLVLFLEIQFAVTKMLSWTVCASERVSQPFIDGECCRIWQD